MAKWEEKLGVVGPKSVLGRLWIRIYESGVVGQASQVASASKVG